MLKKSRLKFVLAHAVLCCLVLSQTGFIVRGQDEEIETLAALDFDPKTDGYGFENYGKENKWQDDLGAEDMIRLFGVKTVCKTGNTAKNCVLKTAAKEWMMQELEGMGNGHCEGMAVTSLRFKTARPFKSKVASFDFDKAAKSTFNLKLTQPIENYIAYYFVTQSMREISEHNEVTESLTPVETVEVLAAAIMDKSDVYSLGFYKFAKGKRFDGHAITPFAVSDAGASYRIHVYDNNYPGETRFVTVEKAGKQTWKYVTSTNPNEKAAEYTGNIDTKSLGLTSTNLREGGCFDAPFSDVSTKKQCVPVKEFVGKKLPVASPKAYKGVMAEISLNGEADLLVTNGDGKRIGFDVKSGLFVNEIPNAEVVENRGGKGVDLPRFRIPHQPDAKPLKFAISGKTVEKENNVDMTYSAPGFSIGFDGMKVDTNENLTATLAPNGEELSFTASADGETPEIYYAIDGDEESYFVEIDGATLGGGKTLTTSFDRETGKFQFSDDDADSDKYDVDVTRIDAAGAAQTFETGDVDAGKSDNYELNLGEWDGKTGIELRVDDEGDGFEDDEPTIEASEDNDDDADDADDEGDDEDSDVDNDGQLNDEDKDDDGDGTTDEKDADDDNDGTSDAEDTDDNEEDEEEDGDNQSINLFFQQIRLSLN